MLAPIVLFTYARPQHTRQTIEALKKNHLAKDSDIFIYSDAARSPDKLSAVKEVRDYIQTVDGFRSVTVIHRAKNFGLSNSVIQGVGEVLEKFDKVIVLEDDLVTSPYFLSYMNDALRLYEHDERVISIHGYVYPVRTRLPEAFFLQGADCWGWATWRRGWRIFNPDGQAMLKELKEKQIARSFDFDSTYPYCDMLEAQARGENDSWAIRWYASAYLAEKLTLYPGRSLVSNIGNDGTGTHCGTSITHDVNRSSTPIELRGILVEPSEVGRQAFKQFFSESQGNFARRTARRLKKYIKKLAK